MSNGNRSPRMMAMVFLVPLVCLTSCAPAEDAEADQAMADGSWWLEEPDIPRVGKNIPARKDRLKVLGNGMVPICFVAAVLDLLQLVESLDEN